VVMGLVESICRSLVSGAIMATQTCSVSFSV
jgi:hypothetical protein